MNHVGKEKFVRRVGVAFERILTYFWGRFWAESCGLNVIKGMVFLLLCPFPRDPEAQMNLLKIRVVPVLVELLVPIIHLMSM